VKVVVVRVVVVSVVVARVLVKEVVVAEELCVAVVVEVALVVVTVVVVPVVEGKVSRMGMVVAVVVLPRGPVAIGSKVLEIDPRPSQANPWWTQHHRRCAGLQDMLAACLESTSQSMNSGSVVVDEGQLGGATTSAGPPVKSDVPWGKEG